MPALVPVHGGLTEPVCRTVPADEIVGFVAHAQTLIQVPVSDADLSTVYRLGDGGLRPLTVRWMRRPTIACWKSPVIEHLGKFVCLDDPIALPATADSAARLKWARKWPW